MKLKNTKLWLATLFVLVITIILIGSFMDISPIFSNLEKAKNFINQFGVLGPLVLFALIVVGIILFLFPNTIFMMTGGYLYGVFWASILSLFAYTVGSTIVFLMVKRYGRPFVEKRIDRRELHHFDIWFRKQGKVAFFLSRLFPIFPSDVANFVVGLSPITLKDFIWITVVGSAPEVVVYCLLGKQILTGTIDLKLIVLIVIAAIAMLGYLFRHELRKFFIKEIRLFEEEMKKVEADIAKGVKYTKEELIKIEEEIKGEIFNKKKDET